MDVSSIGVIRPDDPFQRLRRASCMRLTGEDMAPITEMEIKSLGDLIDKVTATEPDPVTGRRRDSGVYRRAHPCLC
jgi:hypothetical protein